MATSDIFGLKVWNKLDNMNEQLAIKRSIQLQSIFGTGEAISAKELVSLSSVIHSPYTLGLNSSDCSIFSSSAGLDDGLAYLLYMLRLNGVLDGVLGDDVDATTV